jgi:hypothetical protein
VTRCQAADATFPRITAHALRHTAASLAISAGANPKVVQRMLGHASAAMTLDVYADLFDSDLDSVAENVGKMCEADFAAMPRRFAAARAYSPAVVVSSSVSISTSPIDAWSALPAASFGVMFVVVIAAPSAGLGSGLDRGLCKSRCR